MAESLQCLDEFFSDHSFDGLLARSLSMKRLFEKIARVAPSSANVLISGESGTGKERVANVIHKRSANARGPFIAINCSAIPADLLESELFGHARGAFTGAQQRRKGLFQEASGGTLFLDEIGELPTHLQAKLLRVLQERRVRPVGENREVDVNFRLVCATNVDLPLAIQKNRFREDLFYRLSVVPIQIPPLRHRLDDIPLLADYFLGKFRSPQAVMPKGFAPEAMDALCRHPWPGNVRELENTIERAVVFCEDPWIGLESLSLAPMPHATSLSSQCPESCSPSEMDCNLRLCELSRMHPIPNLNQLEDFYIQRVMEHSDGSKERAANLLGISSRTLRRRGTKTTS